MCVNRGLPKAGSPLLMKMMSLSHLFSGEDDDDDNEDDDDAVEVQDYSQMTMKQIKDTLMKRKLDVSTNKKMLITALHLYDNVYKASKEIVESIS